MGGTMTARQLLADLHVRGIELRARGDRLRWRPVQALSDADRQALAAHKAELLTLLAGVQTPATAPVKTALGQEGPPLKGDAARWSAELAELVCWFKANAER